MALTSEQVAEAISLRAYDEARLASPNRSAGAERSDMNVVIEVPEPARHYEAACESCFCIKPKALIESGRCADCR